MDSEQWQQVKFVFEQVVDLPAAQQNDALKRLTESSDDVRREVESLLEFDSPKQVICSAAAPLDGNTSGAIIGDYRLNFPLAINDRTEVWQATSQSLSASSPNRKVAIKFLKDLSGDSRREQRFRQEAAILARFDHPGIAKFCSEGESPSGVPWFATAYVEGQDIVSMADQHGLSLDQRLELFDQVLASVEYSHRFLVVHRDLKPANIVVDAELNAVLIDFGISKQMDTVPMDREHLTRTYERTLTPAYASPEQLRGEPVSAVTDVYGAGLVLYELICGHHAYSDQVHEVEKPLFDRILFQMPLPPSKTLDLRSRGLIAIGQEEAAPKFDNRLSDSNNILKSRFAKGLDEIIMRAIAKDPSDRFASVSDFRKSLTRFSQGNVAGKKHRKALLVSRIRDHVGLSMLLSGLAGAALALAIWIVLTRPEDANLDSKFNRELAELKDRVQFLTQLNHPDVDVESIPKLGAGRATANERLLVLEKAMRQSRFDLAVDIVPTLSDQAHDFSLEDRFRFADSLFQLGKPLRAIQCLDLTPDQFESLVQSDRKLERFRSLYSRLLIETGAPSLARAVNVKGLSESRIEQFERDLVESEIRIANQWFDGLQERLESMLESYRFLQGSRDNVSRLFVLHNERFANIAELHDAISSAPAATGLHTAEKLKLALANRLLDDGETDESTGVLIELVQQYAKNGVPAHPVAMRCLITADRYSRPEINIVKWWDAHRSDVEFGTTDAFELFAAVARRKQLPGESLASLMPHFDRLLANENASIRIAVMLSVWRGVIRQSDSTFGLRFSEALASTANEIFDQETAEFLEAMTVAVSIRRLFSDSDEEQQQRDFEVCQRALRDLCERNQQNFCVAILKAIDSDSADALFRIQTIPDAYSNAQWIREFINHRHNRKSDQLEMVSFFAEKYCDTNPEDVRRMIAVAKKFQDSKEIDWGKRGKENWDRIERVQVRIDN